MPASTPAFPGRLAKGSSSEVFSVTAVGPSAPPRPSPRTAPRQPRSATATAKAQTRWARTSRARSRRWCRGGTGALLLGGQGQRREDRGASKCRLVLHFQTHRAALLPVLEPVEVSFIQGPWASRTRRPARPARGGTPLSCNLSQSRKLLRLGKVLVEKNCRIGPQVPRGYALENAISLQAWSVAGHHVNPTRIMCCSLTSV